MASTGVGETLLAALQASVSVLLVISYGGLAAKLGILSPDSTKAVSKVCVRMFLPALLITKLGAELDAGSAGKYGVIVLWGLLAHFISFLIGILGHMVFKMPDWVTVAVMFNNTASYPLLLIGALQQTGILSSLLVEGETTAEAIERANAYFLVFSTISNCLTFAVGPRLIDTEHAAEPESDSDTDSDHDDDEEPPANEETGLINGNRLAVPDFQNPFGDHRSFFPSTRTRKPSTAPNGASRSHANRRASLVPRKRWIKLSPRTKWWLVFLSDFLNAPLLGAIAGAVIGLTPALHRAFFNDTQHGGIFTAWLTASLQRIGTLFVPLPVVIAGTSLYTAYKHTKEQKRSSSDDHEDDEEEPKGLPWMTVSYIMLVRFVIWPVAAIGLVYVLAAKTSILGDDPMLWFTMMLMPCGPPAMKLITLVQVSDSTDEEQGIIAKLLMISYLISPVLSFTVVGSLRAAQSAV